MSGKVGKTEQEKVKLLSDQYFSISADANYLKIFLARKQNISAALLNSISTKTCRDIRLNFPLSYQELLINSNKVKTLALVQIKLVTKC